MASTVGLRVMKQIFWDKERDYHGPFGEFALMNSKAHATIKMDYDTDKKGGIQH